MRADGDTTIDRAGRDHRRGWISSLAALLVAPAVIVGVAVTQPVGVVEAAPRQIEIGTPGPLGAVTVIGDSVLLGSALWGPTLPDRLAERGWGPIRFRAGEGYSVNGRGDFGARRWIAAWRSQGWDAPNVFVNLGANDSGVCGTNLSCARSRIQEMVDEIGPGHRIWWPKITRLFTKFPEQDTWNRALQEFADNRSDFFTWDWPAELPQYQSSDGTHLTPNGYRTRSIRMADLFTRDLATARRVGSDAALASTTGTPATFVTLPAERVVDTRFDDAPTLGVGDERAVDFGDRLPAGATAVVLYVGAARPQTRGFFTVTPCGQSSDASTVNYRAGAAIGAPTIVALGNDDTVCVSSSGVADLVVDLQGAFIGSPDGLRFSPLPLPGRLVDTRKTGRATELVVPVPAGADAVAVNFTAVRADSRGYLAAYPCGEPTSTANLNFNVGSAFSASAIVNVSADATICVTTNVSTDVIVDITGTFASGDGLRYVPVVPTRMLDTRSAIGGWSPIHGAGQRLDVRVAPATAKAVTGTITMVRPLGNGYVTAEGCAGSAPTSSANAGAGVVIANSLTMGISSTGRLCITSSTIGQTLFDTTGWWVE